MASHFASLKGSRPEAYFWAFFFNIVAALAVVMLRIMQEGFHHKAMPALPLGLLMLVQVYVAFKLTRGVWYVRTAWGLAGFGLTLGLGYALHEALFVGKVRNRDLPNLFWMYYFSQVAVWELLAAVHRRARRNAPPPSRAEGDGPRGG